LFEVLGQRQKRIASIESSLFDKQLAFIRDSAKKKAAQCGRRAGKSYCAGAYLLLEMEKTPNCNVLFAAKTAASAKNILLKDVIGDLKKKHNLPLKVNRTEGIVTHANGSQLFFMGLDADKDQSEKVLGRKFKLAVVDECASYRVDLKHVIDSSIVPCLADLEGTMCMIGTTGHNTNTMWFDITGRSEEDPERELGWSIHKWTYKDNPESCEQVQKQIDEILKTNPYATDLPHFRRMYLNEWVLEKDKLVYRYQKDRNVINRLPDNTTFNYSLTVDPGYEDDTAFVVTAFSSEDPCAYFVEAYKRKKMDITDIVEMIRAFEQRYKFVSYYIDGAAKQAVEEMINRHQIPFQATDKRGKFEVIQLMNADLTSGKVKILPAAEMIFEEAKVLSWIERGHKLIENPKQPNHLCDAALYGWRMSLHYTYKPRPKKIEEFSDEWEQQYIEKIEAKVAGKENNPWWARDWAGAYGIRRLR
jgi:hypothetical protein